MYETGSVQIQEKSGKKPQAPQKAQYTEEKTGIMLGDVLDSYASK